MGKGYFVSFIIAVIIGVVGGIFEALILLPLFGFVTVTAGPVIFFLVANGLYCKRLEDRSMEKGAKWGFLNVILVIIISFFAFIFALELVGGVETFF